MPERRRRPEPDRERRPQPGPGPDEDRFDPYEDVDDIIDQEEDTDEKENGGGQ
jgi:hypothetical protein